MVKALLILNLLLPGKPSDSLRVETVDGKQYIIHRIDPGETLASIAARYKSSEDEIAARNPSIMHYFQVGYRLQIPYYGKVTPSKTTQATKQPKPADESVSSSTSSSPPSGGHVVEKGQTVYSISRLYNVSVSDIVQWNNLSGNAIKVGQTLVIKATGTAPAVSPVRTPETQTTPMDASSETTYVVQPKETLYSLAKRFGTTVDKIKEWNNIGAEGLQAGKRIWVVAPNGSMPQDEPSKPTPKTETKQPSLANKIEAKTPAAPETKAVEKTATVSTTPPTNAAESPEVVENGFVELMEDGDKTKYLGWHRTAPVGSIIKVKNPATNKEVFVRIAGTLDTTDNQVVLKITHLAAIRLGSTPPFKVEVVYYK